MKIERLGAGMDERSTDLRNTLEIPPNCADRNTGIRRVYPPRPPNRIPGRRGDERAARAIRGAVAAPLRLPACAPTRSSGAYSRTARTPTGPFTARPRAWTSARDRALATQLAYGIVQRRATLDHVIETLAGRAVGQARARRARGAAARGLPARRSSTGCPRTPRSASRSSSRRRASRARRRPGQRGAAARGARGARAGRRAARRDARRGRAAPLVPASGSPSCGSTRSAPDAPGR